MECCNKCGSLIEDGKEMYVSGKVYCPQCWKYLVTNMGRPVEEDRTKKGW